MAIVRLDCDAHMRPDDSIHSLHLIVSRRQGEANNDNIRQKCRMSVFVSFQHLAISFECKPAIGANANSHILTNFQLDSTISERLVIKRFQNFCVRAHCNMQINQLAACRFYGVVVAGLFSLAGNKPND